MKRLGITGVEDIHLHLVRTKLKAALSAGKPSSRKSRWGKEIRGPDHLQGVLPQNWSGSKANCTGTCMLLKAKTNDRCKIPALSRDEFRGP
ncbi:hypothetical protein TNCV_4481951 [Trichonephila clavipes]|nr:hypothetical protein TNCV_4481951 [Trichonephila clavipes]